MAKPRTPNQRKRYEELNKRLNRRVMTVNAYYDQLSEETARIVSTLTDYDPSSGKPFRFKDYPITKSSIDQLMRMFNLGTRGAIYSSVSEEWDNSNAVQDLMANDVLRAYGVDRKSDAARDSYRKNQQEMKEFRRHKDKNGTVAQKVWNQTYNFKRELEYAISCAYEPGIGVIELGRRISAYMHDFQRLRSDYKKKFGKDVECQNCKWRTVRLVRSEANMAYRAAEQERWRQMGYVIGYEIKLSHKHPKPDMCDDLVGIYPIWFKWLGWHPLCMCYCVPKTNVSQDTVNLPANFLYWFDDHIEKIYKSWKKGTTPYWISDNVKKLKKVIGYDFFRKQPIFTPNNETSLPLDDYLTLFKQRRRLFYTLFHDRKYSDVSFNPNNLGLKAIHEGHNKSDKKDNRFFVNEDGVGLTGKELEIECQNILFAGGHCCILGPEGTKGDSKNKIICLDMVLDDEYMDIRSLTTNPSDFGNALASKYNQILGYNLQGGKSDSLCLYFHDSSYFSEDKIEPGIKRAKRLLGVSVLPYKHLVFVLSDGRIIYYDIKNPS